MKASDLFVKCLENQGVKYIFGLPGEENLDILESLSASSIKFVTVRHEQGAAFMADVYGRLSQTPGVCLSTLGPGATNLITGVADANLDRAPLVAITGQGGLERAHKESHQYIDVVATMRYVTKWNRTITRPDFIPEIVSKAFKIAAAEKPGATHIELPEDIAAEEASTLPLRSRPLRGITLPDPRIVSEAAAAIARSKAALILAGNGVVRAGASGQLVQLARKSNLYVVNTFMGKGVISARDPLALGTLGLRARDFVQCAFDRADTVICVGYDVVEYSPSIWNRDKGKSIIHIDSRHSEVDGYYQASIEMIGNIREILRRLAARVRKKPPVEYFARLRSQMLAELERFRSDASFPMKPQKIIYDIRQELGDEDILLSDVGSHKMWISRLYPAYRPNTTVISNGFASMGIALPGAIAAKLLNPKKKVLAAMGDGGFLMNVQELETAKRLGTAFVGVIFNDSSYSLIQWKQENEGKKPYGVSFTNPDIVKLAESFGVCGARIRKASEFRPALKKALSSGKTWLIDVPVDYDENLKLSQKLGKDVCIL